MELSKQRQSQYFWGMSQLFGLIILITMAGCDSTAPSEVNTGSDAEGGVAFTFTRGAQKATDGFPEPTNVRVIVRRFESGEVAFNALTDVQVPTDTTVVLSVPANAGYRIDAFSYIDSTQYIKPLLKFDQVQGVDVAPDSVTSVSLVLEPATISISLPDSVEQGDKFAMSARVEGFFEMPNGGGYDAQYIADLKVDSTYVDMIDRDVAWDYTNWYTPGDSAVTWEGVSISEFGGTYAYFHLSAMLEADEFYKADDAFRSFVYNYPNPYVADTVRTFVKVPAGGIGVDVVY